MIKKLITELLIIVSGKCVLERGKAVFRTRLEVKKAPGEARAENKLNEFAIE